MSALPAALPWLLLAGVLGVAYLKIGLVLFALRRGLGGIPPISVTAILALLLSGLVMAPVAERARAAMADAADPGQQLSAGIAPVRAFLLKNTPARDRAALLDLARQVRLPAERAQVQEQDLAVLAPAFALSEVRLGVEISILLLLPFLVLDLLVASLLQGLLLWGLPARSVALPFKLLLFVLCDGWHLLARGLVLGYA